MSGVGQVNGISNSYYRAVHGYQPLGHQDLLALSRQWHAYGDYKARDAIVVHNLRLPVIIATHYQNRGLDYDDLVQAGNIGLVVAAERFDPERGTCFNTYATWWIKRHIICMVQRFYDVVPIPAKDQDALNKIIKIKHQLKTELLREPTVKEVAKRAGKDAEQVKKILRLSRAPTVSLEKQAYGALSLDIDTTIGDRIADRRFPSAVTALEAKEKLEEMSLRIRALLASVDALPISGKIKTAFKMYYGLEGYAEGATLESIAKTSGFKVTRERIWQMIAEVWKRLAKRNKSMNSKQLVATLNCIHALEDIVCVKADLSLPIKS